VLVGGAFDRRWAMPHGLRDERSCRDGNSRRFETNTSMTCPCWSIAA